VVLFGVDYWSGLVEWLQRRPLTERKISPPDMNLFTLTDSIEEAAETIVERHRAHVEAQKSVAATEQALKEAAAE
jgi:predicted Rossmann-fold nucleotide-binding protein